MNFIDVESRAFDCRYSAGIVRCTGGTIAPGDLGTVRIIVEPEEAGTIQNTAMVFVAGIREPLDSDTEQTVVRQDNDPGDPGDPDDPGDGCSEVVDTETEEPIGVLTGTEDLFFEYTNDQDRTLPLRIVYATSSKDGKLTVRVIPKGGGAAILEETIQGAKEGVLIVDTKRNTTYEVEVLPEDQGYAVLFEVGEGTEKCTDPESLDPEEVASASDDPEDDVVDEVDNEEKTLADTGGVPLAGIVPLAAALLLVVGISTVRGVTRR